LKHRGICPKRRLSPRFALGADFVEKVCSCDA
jgi:hypothetical protein